MFEIERSVIRLGQRQRDWKYKIMKQIIDREQRRERKYKMQERKKIMSRESYYIEERERESVKEREREIQFPTCFQHWVKLLPLWSCSVATCCVF